ncbi:endo alpha-1,4 polygalactosaminidase [Lysobacter korlensis]|uniref:Endo alpha-1,4 polygalactosaminidase n=1 Tax=Lysobacter korlensis TaxID=553636 RepID=A0ABV6RWJ4_9GAMM
MRSRRARLMRGGLAGAALLVVSACSAIAPAASPPPVELPPWYAPFDYQLGGAYSPPADVALVVRDSTEPPATGLYSICYVNGFQTQPGADWPDDLLLRENAGAPVVDPDWPDEHLLDISTEAKRELIFERLAVSIAACADAGFQAVEFDNLDSYSRSDGRLTLEHAIDMARRLVLRAHQLGLAAGQKNTPELGSRGREEAGFDFVISEECDRFDECRVFTDSFGSSVFNIEYADALRGSAEEVCGRPTTPSATIIRDRDLMPTGSPGYFFQAC